MTIEEIIPPAVKPFDSIKDRVAADWIFEQQRHEQETAAATMLAAIQAGRNFADAATIAGVIPHLTPLVTRGEGAAGMPPELQRILFGLKKGEPAMVELSQGFVVAIPAEIAVADPNADKAGFDKLRAELAQNIASDYAGVFQEAVRLRANPRINRANFDQIVQPQQ